VTHADVRELIAPYAVGALDEADAAVVHEHLRECGFCTNLAREASEVAHYLPYAAPYKAAPPGSLHRLLAAIRRDARPAVGPLPSSLPTGEGTWRRWTGWLRRPVFAPVAAGAALVLAMAGWNFSLMGELKGERRQMTALQTRLAQQTHLLVMVTSSSAVTRPLQGTPLAPSAEIRLIMDGQTNSAMLMAMRLPPLPSGRVYQVWLGRQGARMPAGRLLVDDDGNGECILQLDSSVHSYDSAWITLEPEGGPMPNSPGIARGVL
jgi:hypothetical protein